MTNLRIGEWINLYGKVTLEVVAIRKDVTTLVFVDPTTKVARDKFFHRNLVAYRNNQIQDHLNDGSWTIAKGL